MGMVFGWRKGAIFFFLCESKEPKKKKRDC